MKGMRLGREKPSASAGALKIDKKKKALQRGQKAAKPKPTSELDDAIAKERAFCLASVPWVDARTALARPAEGQEVESLEGRLVGCAHTCWLSSSSSDDAKLFATSQDVLRESLENSAIWPVVATVPPRRAARLDGDEHASLLNESVELTKAAAGVLTGIELGRPPFGETAPCADLHSQKEAFLAHAAHATSRGLALALVVRHSDGEEKHAVALENLLEWMKEAEVKADYPIHWLTWSGSPATALKVLKLYPNSMLGFSASISFRGSGAALRELAFDCPGDRLLLESDAPYGAPDRLAFPHSSWTVPMVAQIVATQKRQNSDAVISQANSNACKLYKRELTIKVREVEGGADADAASKPTGTESLSDMAKFLPDSGSDEEEE